jgi:hypothetical protein
MSPYLLSFPLFKPPYRLLLTDLERTHSSRLHHMFWKQLKTAQNFVKNSVFQRLMIQVAVKAKKGADVKLVIVSFPLTVLIFIHMLSYLGL